MAPFAGRAGLKVALLAASLIVGVCMPADAAWATSWSTGLGGSSTGEGEAQGAPGAPTGATSACATGLGNRVTVAWNAVTHASTYAVYQSTTSATTGYALAAAGVTTTTWTSGGLASGTYWFEVAAFIGLNWSGSNSVATAKRTILLVLCN